METKKNVKKVYDAIMRLANTDRWNNNSSYNSRFNELGDLLMSISKLDCLAGKVAKTIEGKMSPFARKVAFISEKQCWVLAFAVVENNIEFDC